MKLLHIADVHLGGSGPAFGQRVRDHQRRLLEAFRRCIDWALKEQVAAVCIVGDLFDRRRPTERTVEGALAELRRLGAASPPIPCFILPGTHDCLDAGSVYQRQELTGEHLHVWQSAGPASFRLPDGSLAVHGNPHSCGSADHRPLTGLKPDPEVRFNVALAHGAVLIPGLSEGDSSLITREEIAQSGMDYIALGHWHSAGDYSTGGVTAWYSGSPEVVAVDTPPGCALLVTLGEGGANVQRLDTASLRCEVYVVNVEELSNEAAIATQIRARQDPNVLLDVTVQGLAPEGFWCDVARLQEELEGGFFRLRITDKTTPPPEELAKSGAGGRLVAARALAILRGRVAAAEEKGDERALKIARRALQLAAALLAGREVLE